MPRVYLVMAIIGAGLLALGSTFLLAVPLVSDHASPSSLFLKGERHFDNLIVNSGIQGVANLIAPAGGGSGSPFNYIALGTGTTPVNAAQTALVAEFPASSGYSRINVPVAAFSTSNNQLLLSATFGPGQATGPISESGVFNAANGGTMLARQTFSTINKGMSDSLTVSWAIVLSSS